MLRGECSGRRALLGFLAIEFLWEAIEFLGEEDKWFESGELGGKLGELGRNVHGSCGHLVNRGGE